MQISGTGSPGVAGATEVFAITLLPDHSLAATIDQYSVDILAPIGVSVTRTVNDFVALGQNTQKFKALDVAATPLDLLFSGYERAANGSNNAVLGSSVSASGAGIGVANNSMDDGDNLRIDFAANAIAGPSNNNIYNYDAHYNTNDFQFTIVQVGGSTPADSIEVWVRIYNADNNDPSGVNTAEHSAALSDDPKLSTITSIEVNGVAVNLGSLTSDGTGGYLIRGLDLHDTVLVHASGAGYNRIEVENAISNPLQLTDPTLNGEAFDIGGFSFVTSATTVPSVGLSFDLGLTDADGDKVVSPDAITVQLQSLPVSTVVVAVADASLNDSDNTSPVTFTFSQAPTGFTADDITAVGGTVTGLAGSGTSYTATFTATDGFSGTGAVLVKAGSYTNSTGNPGGAGFDTVAIDTVNPRASLNLAADLLTQTNTESLVTIQFTEAVTGFGPDDLTLVGGMTLELSTFQQIDPDTYTVKLLVQPDFEGTGQVTLTGVYTDLDLNAGIAGATDTVDINTLATTLDATILTTGTSGLGQTVTLTFVDLQNPIFSYAGLYDLGAQGGAFQRDVGFNIDPGREYAVSLEAVGEIPVPIRVLTVEGGIIHIIENVVALQLDNDNSIILGQTALTAIIQPDAATLPQFETASVEGNELANNGLVDPTPTPGSGAGSAENTVNYLYGADGADDLTGSNDTDVLNGGAGNDLYSGGDGNDILIYGLENQKMDGGGGTDVLRTDEAAFGLLNNVGVVNDPATGFTVVEVVPFKQNIKNVEVLLITDDAGSSPTKGGLLKLSAEDVLNMTDENHQLHILGNVGDVVDLDIGVSQWEDRGLGSDGFRSFEGAFNNIELLLKVENSISIV